MPTKLIPASKELNKLWRETPKRESISESLCLFYDVPAAIKEVSKIIFGAGPKGVSVSHFFVANEVGLFHELYWKDA